MNSKRFMSIILGRLLENMGGQKQVPLVLDLDTVNHGYYRIDIPSDACAFLRTVGYDETINGLRVPCCVWVCVSRDSEQIQDLIPIDEIKKWCLRTSPHAPDGSVAAEVMTQRLSSAIKDAMSVVEAEKLAAAEEEEC